jgi:hypothetical protein
MLPTDRTERNAPRGTRRYHFPTPRGASSAVVSEANGTGNLRNGPISRGRARQARRYAAARADAAQSDQANL